MRVLHIGKFYAPFKGGVETYLLDVMQALAERGHEGAALVHGHERGFGVSRERHGREGAGWTVWRAGTWFRAFFTPISPGFRNALAGLVKTFRPDVIHAHLPNPSACWLLTLPETRRIPLVLHWHSDVLTGDQGPVMRLLYRLYRPWERRLLERADAIVATSESYLETSESLQAHPHKCHVVPLGLDEERVLGQDEEPPLAANAATSDRRFQVLAIGRLTYYKGFGYLVRALAELEDTELHIVGQGALRRELLKLARELQVARRIRFHGGLDDAGLAARLRACDVVCLPSIERTEAFGLVLLEAMAFGKPTVASRVRGSGMSWVVEDEVTGLLTPPRDPAALAAALDRLRRDPELARRLGQAGRERFRAQFAIGPSVEALLAVYGEAMKEVADP